MSSPIIQATSVEPRKDTMTRRRAHILERAQAQLSGSACQLTPSQSGKRRVSQTTDEISPSYRTESESQSESSSVEPRGEGSDKESVFSIPEDLAELHLDGHPPGGQPKQAHKKSHSRAWYEFDLAVLVALVSPIGHWLTGGDYVKNLFLIILLIYYLHQIIEVPWTIYQKALQKRPLPASPPTSVEEKYQLIAASELRKIELFFLALTAISPFIGAAFLRYATTATFGPEAVSWFNVSLFILATGMRPWAHIVERLKQRTTDLHDVIQYATPGPNVAATSVEVANSLAELTKKVTKLEKNTRRIEVKTTELREDVYHDLDEIMDKLEGLTRKHEKRHAKHESRVRDVEDTLKTIRTGEPGTKIPTVFRIFPISLLRYLVPSWLYLPPYRILIHVLYPSPTSSPQPQSATSSPKLIQEEGYPLLAQPTQITSALLSRIGYIATLPLRTVMRMILRRY